MFLTIFLSFLISSPVFAVSDKIRVKLSAGEIEGSVQTSTYSPFGNQTGIVFLGIPYAEPPIGELRFRKPIQKTKWNGVLETKKYKSACLSDPVKTYKSPTGGPISEDCLYLNVFTNDYCMKNKNCSVMVAIHGGRYLFESASAFKSDILINNFVGQDRNIVVVSINYRLGILGFGHLYGDYNGSADKNVGLFDILETLKWTQKEISNFGGLPEKVTVMGHSGGAALIFHLGTSSLTKGLFHQQIMMSGPLQSPSKRGNSKATRSTAINVGCLNENTTLGTMETGEIQRAFDCLRKIDSLDLLEAQQHVIHNDKPSYGGPYVDRTFIVDYPEMCLNDPNLFKVKTLIGTVSGEIRDSLYMQDVNGDAIIPRLDEFCEHAGFGIGYSDPEGFRSDCVQYYKQKNSSQFLTDDHDFHAPAIRIAKGFYSKKTPSYLYSYTYSGANEAFDKYLPHLPSPTHSEDLIYVFGTHRNAEKMTIKDYEIEKIYSGMFANFINNGDPSPSAQQKWTPFSSEKREYFQIDFDENLEMPGNAEQYYIRANEFWNKRVPSKFGAIHHSERFSESFDVFTSLLHAELFAKHWDNSYNGLEKPLEVNQMLYDELKQFLEQLRTEYKNGTLRSQDIPTAHKFRTSAKDKTKNNFTLNFFLISGSIVAIGIIAYIVITKWCMSQKRQGYILLK